MTCVAVNVIWFKVVYMRKERITESDSLNASLTGIWQFTPVSLGHLRISNTRFLKYRFSFLSPIYMNLNIMSSGLIRVVLRTCIRQKPHCNFDSLITVCKGAKGFFGVTCCYLSFVRAEKEYLITYQLMFMFANIDWKKKIFILDYLYPKTGGNLRYFDVQVYWPEAILNRLFWQLLNNYQYLTFNDIIAQAIYINDIHCLNAPPIVL